MEKKKKKVDSYLAGKSALMSSDTYQYKYMKYYLIKNWMYLQHLYENINKHKRSFYKVGSEVTQEIRCVLSLLTGQS